MTDMLSVVAMALRKKCAEIDHRPDTVHADAMWFADEYAAAAIEALRGHYERWMPSLRKFNERYTVDTDTGCWVWHGAVDTRDGYGRFYDTNNNIPAYTFAYEFFVGEVPAGLTIDHICRNRKCVNPEHLRTVTNAENVLSGEGVTARNARKTHCLRGHPFTGRNVYIRPDGARTCRPCCSERSREFRKKRKAVLAALEGKE